MAKLNKVNIAITGDSKGLVAATDAATKELRRLQVQADQTRQRLSGMRQMSMQTGEALGKFGLQSRALGMAGGALGIAAMGPGGMALAGAGAATAGISMALGALASAVKQIPAERKAAVDALKAIDQDQRRSLSQFGFTRELAQAVSARGGQKISAAEGMSFSQAAARGLAGTNTAQGRLMQSLVNEAPGAFGVFAGTLAGGGGTQLATQRATELMTEGRSTAETFQMVNDLNYAMSRGEQIGKNSMLGTMGVAGFAIQTALSGYASVSNLTNLWSK